MKTKRMRIAVIHDCLTVYGGAEKFLKQVFTIFPEADLFSVIDFFPEQLRHHLGCKQAKASFIQRLPFSRRLFHYYFPLMPLAVEQFDLKDYDLIISSSYAVAKGVLTSPDQMHICYCHSPLRFAWDMQTDYFLDHKMNRVQEAFLRMLFHRFRIWDANSANRVDHFVANSHYVAKRIEKAYRRSAQVIHLGIEMHQFTLKTDKEDFYLAASRLAPYKKIGLVVEAFTHMPQRKLIVIGEGPEQRNIMRMAGSNIQVLGHQPCDILTAYMQRAKAFIFAAKEDYGLMPLEVQACGTPVIAFGKGGACETIQGIEVPKPTGIFFHEQTMQGIIDAVDSFERNQERIQPVHCRENAEKFSDTRFRSEFKNFIDEKIALFQK